MLAMRPFNLHAIPFGYIIRFEKHRDPSKAIREYALNRTAQY
jgi:hypothetical protein